MSSVPSDSSARTPRRRSVALRTTSGVAALVALVMVSLALVTVTVAGRVVDSRLDDQARETWQRTAGFVTGPGRGFDVSSGSDRGGGSREPGYAPGLPIDAISLTVDVTGVVSTASRFDTDGLLTSLPDEDVASLKAVAADYRAAARSDRLTTRLELTSGNYLVMAGSLAAAEITGPTRPGNDGQSSDVVDPDTVLLVGLSTAEVDGTKANLWLIQSVGSAVALLLVGLSVWWWIRRSLRPLHDVSQAAVRVAAVPMASGTVELEKYRVPEPLAQPTDEVGDVGHAMNQLITSVDAALAARSASEQRLRDFIADASHELRTPLAAVRGYADMIRLTESLGQSGQDMLDRVLQQSTRMGSLVENLLLLARLDAAEKAGAESDELAISTKSIDVGELVIDAVTDATATGRDHTWHAHIPPDPVIVPGDRVQLTQLLANLLSNARKHTPAGTVVTTRLSVESGQAVITVTDTGPGIDPMLLGRLFDRFVRGDTARTTTEGSTGLGLSIVRSITRAHGGDVTVTSRPGDTTFSVRLPLEDHE
ncbi:two-component system, OmpR family, sensor kinase [Micrococcales bacterium KH10]|nr:two-component system, OmpR family, sensor kinase [Micrococcales bacterium KH10]